MKISRKENFCFNLRWLAEMAVEVHQHNYTILGDFMLIQIKVFMLSIDQISVYNIGHMVNENSFSIYLTNIFV
jgi:hypothetical protein